MKLFYILFLLISQSIYAQSVDTRLQAADSLFKSKKYTEAFLTYEKLLVQDQYFTPRMLLKMAFIKEGMNDYTAALYYLNLYYTHFPERQVLEKIEQLAAKNKLQGYEVSDFEYLVSLYHRYQVYVVAVVLLLLAVFWFYLFQRKKHHREILYPAIVLSFLLVVFFYVYNYGVDVKKGIVQAEKALLMDDASAGAKQVDVIGKGHCLQIVDKEDIWYKVKWNDKKAYIRQSNLYIID